MKKHVKLFLLPLFALGFFAMAMMFNGCKKVTPGATCIPVDDGCGDKWEACCNTVQCYYSYKGKKYNCDGTNCDEAALELVGDIDCTAGIDLNSLVVSDKVEELLEVVKMLNEANLPCEDL